MSEDSQLPTLPSISSTDLKEPEHDFSEKDLKIIQEYMEMGLPGVAVVDNIKMSRILDMYLSGKTYRQISTIMNIRKEVILYLSHRFKWFEARKEYIEDLERNMRSQLIETRIKSQDFLLQLMSMWQKKIGNNISKYLATDNEDFANNIDLKEVDKYLKTIEILHRISTDKTPSPASSPIGLNVGDGVTITKKGNNEVEITPKSNVIGSLLKEYADMRRAQESEKSDKKS